MTSSRSAQPLALTVVVVLTAAAVAGFASTIAGWAFMSSAVIGVAGAFVIAVACQRFELLLGESVACSLFGFVLLGGVATTGAPSPGAYVRFVDGLFNGWADFLSVAAPVDLTESFRVLPFTIAWWSVVIGIESLRRSRQPLAPLTGPLAGMIATQLLTVGDPRLAQLQGLAMAVGALALASQRPRRGTTQRSASQHSGQLVATSKPSNRLLVGVVIAVAAGSAPLIGPNLPTATRNDRFDLRQLQDRPWNALDQPSPLATLKASLKEPRSDEVVFTVRSETPILRWSLAVLEDYDGVVWAVADESASAAAEFEPVDSHLPLPTDVGLGQSAMRYEVEIGELRGVWLPAAGRPKRADSGLSLRMNLATGTLASPSGLEPQSVIQMSSFPRTELSSPELLASTVPSFDQSTELALLPPRIRNLAGDIFEGVDAGPGRAAAVSRLFATNGFYDAGPTSRPGHSLARIDEFLAEPERLVGYEEQYAASAALLLRSAGVPSRVVVGYVIPEARYDNGVAEVRAGDISAWVEILTLEHGWVPLAVSPDRTQVPEEQATSSSTKEVVIPNPPTPPPPPTDLTQPQSSADDPEPDEDEFVDDTPTAIRSIPTPVVVASVALGTPAGALGLAALVIVGLKRRRRIRRRSSGRPEHQVAGAWRELVDRYHELGVTTSGPTTPSEAVDAFMAAVPTDPDAELELVRLAELLDRSSFHPTPPGPAQVAAAWASTDRIASHMQRALTRWERIITATDPRPLMRRDQHPTRAPRTEEAERPLKEGAST